MWFPPSGCCCCELRRYEHLHPFPGTDLSGRVNQNANLSPSVSPLGFSEPGSGQVFVTSENQLVYYPSITYAIIGSSVIFVLVVALLALVLHHQRKRNNLMTLPVHRLQHPVLLSRLVVLDHPHHCNVTYNVNNGIQYVASQAEQNASEVGSPPSYSEALLDQRCVCRVAEVGGGRLLMGKAEYVPAPGIPGLARSLPVVDPKQWGPPRPQGPSLERGSLHPGPPKPPMGHCRRARGSIAHRPFSGPLILVQGQGSPETSDGRPAGWAAASRRQDLGS